MSSADQVNKEESNPFIIKNPPTDLTAELMGRKFEKINERIAASLTLSIPPLALFLMSAAAYFCILSETGLPLGGRCILPLVVGGISGSLTLLGAASTIYWTAKRIYAYKHYRPAKEIELKEINLSK